MISVHSQTQIDLISMKIGLLKTHEPFCDFLHDFTTVFLRRRPLTNFWPLEAKIVGMWSKFFRQFFPLS